MNHNEPIPDFVMEALLNADLRQTSPFKQWMEENEEHSKLFEELCLCQEAAYRLIPENNPDIEQQWKYVKAKISNEQHPSKKSKTIKLWIGIAALIVLLLSTSTYLIYIKTPKALPHNTVTFIANIPIPPKAKVVIKNTENVPPILLFKEKGHTTPIYKPLLDYTSQQETAEQSHTEQLTVSTPRGKSIKIRLSDHTEVWLNADSRLTYPSQFTDTTRVVTLDGEAYFKVTRNEHCPFIVQQGKTRTRVLGTEFNIRSYDGEQKHITLVSGNVQVSDTLSKQTYKLSPGQDLTYSEASIMNIKEVNVLPFTTWTENLFYFEDAKLQDIMRTLGRWYNTTVAFEDPEIADYHFTFWAKRTDSLTETLSLLNQMGTVKAYINTKGNQVIIKKR